MNIGIAMSMHMHIIMLVCFFMRISNPFTYSQSSFLPVTIALCMVKVNGCGRKKALLCKLTKFGKRVWIILSVSMVRLRDLPDGAAAQHGLLQQRLREQLLRQSHPLVFSFHFLP